MAAKETLNVLYDGECPFCKRYVHMIRLRDNLDVRLTDAREASAFKDKATALGYDLDKGMLAEYQGKYYYGDKAVFLLSSLSTPSDLFNKVMMKVFANKTLAGLLYPVFAFGRRVTLTVLQNDLIANLQRRPDQKIAGFTRHSLRDIASSPLLLTDVCVRLAAFCVAVTMVYSWPLWFEQTRIFSPVPIFKAFVLPFAVTQGLAYAALLLSVLLFAYPRLRWLGKAVTVLFALLVLQDELRWQPFMYMYVFILFAASFIPRQAGQKDLSVLRYMVVGLYFWAGFYKINSGFVLSVFPWFVKPLGLNDQLVFWMGCLTPFVECAIGLCLFFVRTRVIGVFLATVMLVVVLACLGPLGHNWAMIVWPWNVLLHATELLLFLYYKDSLVQKDILQDKRVWLAVLLFWLLPAMAMINKWGDNPSFMLYSGLPITATVEVSAKEDLAFLPPIDVETVQGKQRFELVRAVINTLNVGPTSAVAGDGMIVEGSKGICAHLLYPAKARLIVHKLPSFWSVKYNDVDRPLCPKAD